MGRVCRAGRKVIDDIIEGGESIVRRQRRAARRARARARRNLDETEEAIRGLDDSNLSPENQRRMREALEELREQYRRALDDADKQLENLGEVSAAYADPLHRVSDTFLALDRASDDFKDLSFVDASKEIERVLTAAHGTVDTERPGPDLTALAHYLSDDGLDEFAADFGFPVPSELGKPDGASARALYSAMVPLMVSLHPEDIEGDTDDLLTDALTELVEEAIAATSAVPIELLEMERAYSQRLPVRLLEYRDLPPGDAGAGVPISDDDDLALLRLQKAEILRRRDRDRNTQIGKALLAVIGLDFLLDEVEEDAGWIEVLDLLMNGTDLVLAAIMFGRIVKRLLSRPGLWSRLVRRYGRLGAARLLAGLSGRLVPAIFAVCLALAWKSIYSDWQERKAEWDRDLRRLYDRSTATGKADLFMENLGYIPPREA